MPVNKALTLLCCVLVLSACKKKDNVESITAPPTFKNVEQTISSYINNKVLDVDASVIVPPNTNRGYDGATIVVMAKGEGIVYKQSFGDFINNDRFYHFGSTGKIVSSALFTAIDEDPNVDFSLTAPIDDYLPYNGFLRGRGITTEHLLSNTAGIPGLPNLEELDLFVLAEALLSFSYNCQLQNDIPVSQCSEQIYNTELPFFLLTPPGANFRYGGAQWYMSADVAQKATGMEWNNLLSKYLLEPCGLTDLVYSNSSFAITFNRDTYPSKITSVDQVPYTDTPIVEGGLVGSIDAYAKFLDMVLNDGMCGATQVISQAGLANLRRSRVTEQTSGIDYQDQAYGLGWFIDHRQGSESPNIFFVPGIYGAMAWIDTDRDYAAVVVMEGFDVAGIINRDGSPVEWYRSTVMPLVAKVMDARSN